MWASLCKLMALPADTRVYCAHEYTQSNIRFARVVEPENAALKSREARVMEKRADGRGTVPFSLGEELATNPFLRCAEAAVAAAAQHYVGRPLGGDVEVFAALREWKNNFR
jgi:hydroxyacylglutathione hydrolase